MGALKGEFYLLVQDLRLFDNELFFRYFRMNAAKYEELLAMIAPEIQKSSITWECIGPSERLCVTLRYLTTGDSQTTIALNYRISPTTIGRIIFTTCEALSVRFGSGRGFPIATTSHETLPKRSSRLAWKNFQLQIVEEWQWNTVHATEDCFRNWRRWISNFNVQILITYWHCKFKV